MADDRAMLSELGRVKLAARGAAVALAGGVFALMLTPAPARIASDGALGAPAILVSLETRERVIAPRTERRPPERRHDDMTQTAALPDAPDDAEEGRGLRLWFDGAASEVAFEDGDHYLRCLDARLDYVETAGCPSLEGVQRLRETFATNDGALAIERQGLPRRRRR